MRVISKSEVEAMTPEQKEKLLTIEHLAESIGINTKVTEATSLYQVVADANAILHQWKEYLLKRKIERIPTDELRKMVDRLHLPKEEFYTLASYSLCGYVEGNSIIMGRQAYERYRNYMVELLIKYGKV